MRAPQETQPPPARCDSPSALRDPPRRALPLGVVLALALHGAVVGLAAWTTREMAAAPVALRPAPAPPLYWIEEEAPQPETPAVAVSREAEPGVAEPAPPASDSPVGEVAPSVASRAVAPAPPASEQRAGAAPRPRLAARGRAETGAAPNPPGGEDSSGSDVSALPSGEPGAGAASGEASGEASSGAPSLSLEALGIGKNPFLTPPPAKTGAEIRAELGRRIDHVLRDGLAKHDQELGLGPEGPAVTKLTELVMQSTTRPNTSALLSLRTDGSGEVVHVEVAEASGDSAGWSAVAAELLRSLRGKKLRVPSGTGGVTMQLRVDSREQLPSGADPGLAVDLFGQELKKGEGERSTRISLLKPQLVLGTYELVPGDSRTKIPVVGISLTLFSLAGDVTDIGAPARRVVHAHLVSMQTHPLRAE